MRFGTAGARPFQRAARVPRCVTLRTPAPGRVPRCSAAVAARVTTQRAAPRVSARFPFARRRVTSFLGRTRLCTVIDALLLPRSAPRTPPRSPTATLRRRARARLPRTAAGASRRGSAPSIFGTPQLGGYVATRFFADADLHGHRPAVRATAAPSLAPRSAAHPPRRFTPPCGPRLPQAAHWRAPGPQAVHTGPRARSEFAGSPASSLPHGPGRAPLSCETFRREPATRRLVWSFAPTPTSRQRVEHQYGCGPPPAFPPASACAGVVRRLSGPATTTRGSPPAPALARSPRRRGGLLGPCFNTGPSPRIPPHFRFSPPIRRLFRVRSRYFSAIGPAAYLALDASTTPSRCATRQRYSLPALRPGLSPALAPLSNGLRALRHNARRLSTGAPPCSLAATTGIRVRFFSWP